MDEQNRPAKPLQDRLMHYGMMACCVVMLLPIVGYFVAGGTLTGVWNNAGAFAPILLCVGAHLAMHKFMGKSCHAEKSKEPETTIEMDPGSVETGERVVARNTY